MVGSEQSDSFIWRKSTYSVANGACAEVAAAGEIVAVRDSLSPIAGQLQFPAVAWEHFIQGVKRVGVRESAGP